MRRRNFISLVGGAAAWPMVVRAQQQAMPVIGFIRVGPPAAAAPIVDAFLEGLRQGGYVDGQNVRIEFRWPEDQGDKMRELMQELVRKQVVVIVANGNSAAIAAKRATATTSVVFVVAGDPVSLGLVASLNRPGGNLTGMSVQGETLIGKQIELLATLTPNLGPLGYLVNPTNANSLRDSAEAEAAARAIGAPILIVNASRDGDLEHAFATLAAQRAGGVAIENDALFNQRLERLAALAALHRIPAINSLRDYASAGGLIGYGSSREYGYRQAGIMTGRVLKGERPADLPIDLAAKIELVINLKTAKALGLTVPLTLLGRADEVIE
jgi:putative ABC transport system substrate-binding protein